MKQSHYLNIPENYATEVQVSSLTLNVTAILLLGVESLLPVQGRERQVRPRIEWAPCFDHESIYVLCVL
jgi:hypothetical protein